jgi:hypothetical protein
MITRLLVFVFVSCCLSGCLATPRLFSPYSSEYEPPEQVKQQPQQETGQQKSKLNDETKEEIRRQVQEEVAKQNATKAINTPN